MQFGVVSSAVDAVASMVDSAVDAWVKPTLFTTMKQWSVLVADNVVPQVHACLYLLLLTQHHLTEPHVPPLVPLLQCEYNKFIILNKKYLRVSLCHSMLIHWYSLTR